MDRMGWACSTQGENLNAYMILVGNPVRKRPLGEPTLKLNENIKVCLR
jgi:hypothetical protein